MPILTTTSKIREFLKNHVLAHLDSWVEQAAQGDLLGFEQSVNEQLRQVHNEICEQVLPRAADQSRDGLKRQAKAQGCSKIVSRPLQLRLATGHFVTVQSPYAKQAPAGFKTDRRLLASHWKLIGRSSPLLYDRVGFCAAVSPSFESGFQLLKKFNVDICLSSVQKLTLQLAHKCHDVGEACLSLRSEETVAGKTVVISMDGGRTRTRQNLTYRNGRGNLRYDTPWREPKLFVIDVIDSEGRVDREQLPIYGTRFDQGDAFDLLKQYLGRLNIDQAEHVQLIGDGAAWIWNNLKDILLEMGVGQDRITETLDIWHASEYVHKLVDNMGSRKSEPEKRKLKKQFSNLLWQGKCDEIVAQCKSIYRRKTEVVRRCINYLEKHLHRSQYADYKYRRLMCGSGIVESAIRRVINLRFKNAATFWYAENVEKMYFLRASVLSGRWNTVIQNLQI